jgi:diaminopimelate epimerase
MLARYAARGNIYVVATPDEVEFPDAQLARNAGRAARAGARWAQAAVDRLCSREQWEMPSRRKGEKQHASGGLIVGPFPQGAPHER